MTLNPYPSTRKSEILNAGVRAACKTLVDFAKVYTTTTTSPYSTNVNDDGANDFNSIVATRKTAVITVAIVAVITIITIIASIAIINS